MKHRSVVATLTSVFLLFVCLFQGVLGQHVKVGHPSGTGNVGGGLIGEWRVKCGVSVYQNGRLGAPSPDDADSLVVVESDPDGSYQLYKFPVGFGEGFPRIRKVSANQYAGDDTVRGIATLVKQSVDLVDEKITIRQAVIDAPSKQTLTETICTGARLQSAMSLPPGHMAEVCASSPPASQLPDKKLARRYKSVRPFSDGLAAVAAVPQGSRTKKWGFIDDTGRVVIPMRYDEVTSFQGELAAAGKLYGHGRNLKWAVIEKMGPQVTPHVNYDAVKILGEGFAAVGYAVPGRQGLKWNLINRENTTIFYGFDDIGCFVSGRARASVTEGNIVRTGYVDRVGDFFADKK